MTPELIESLLHEEEGTALDFKRDQYKFERSSEQDKSELLKDILAFVNSFRRSDAYILVGVEEIQGSRSGIVGVSAQLDDAKLQQFVNSKTQRPVTFSYRAVTHDGHPIGIIHVPVQARPIYTTVSYGKVIKENVYLRRGSSTDIAKPEEIALMGAASIERVEQPSVELNLVDRSTGNVLGDRASIDKCTWYEIPPKEKIPDYSSDIRAKLGSMEFVLPDISINENFLRDLAQYIQTEAYYSVSLEMHSTGGTIIHDARLVIELHDPERRYEILTSQDRANPPDPANSILPLIRRPFVAHPDVFVARQGETWKVECAFGKVQPHATVRLQDDLLIGCRSAGETTICGMVYADNIISPIPVRIYLSFQVGTRPLAIHDIKRMATEFIGKE